MGHPASVEALCYLNSGSATAEGIENEVAFVGGGFDDAFEEGFRLLNWELMEDVIGIANMIGHSTPRRKLIQTAFYP